MHNKTLAALLFFALITSPLFSFADMQSTNYKIQGETINAAGGSVTRTTYKAYGGAGETFSGQGVTVDYEIGIGANYPTIANVPFSPSLTNPADYYDRLHFAIDPSGNPTDTVFAIAISYTSWADLQYLQADNTVGTSPVWQTYDEWGGVTGETAIGLYDSRTYCIKAKALNGDFTGTRFGPETCIATVAPFLSFDLSANSVNFGALLVNSVNTAATDITATISTNAQNGYVITAKDTGNGVSPGLFSVSTNYLLPSLSATLTGTIEGYGFKATSSTATVVAPYNGSGETVGGLALTPQNFATKSSPSTNDTVIVTHKAAVSTNTRAGADYQDTITYTATTRY